MKLTGGSIIATEMQEPGEGKFYAVNPVSGEKLQPGFTEASAGQIETAVAAAARDFQQIRQLTFTKRADFLTAVAVQLRAIEGELIARANLETGLPEVRLQGELTRTVNQLLMFADFVRDGAFLQTLVEPALPDRQPLPRPDLRRTEIPLGPVAVFGASNFPLAFSVAGGDCAAAFAASCPVIVKGHPAHPGTCELAGRAIVEAVQQCGLPLGMFSLLQGESHGLGAKLVTHPLLKAVAFTGSFAGGRALFDLAAARPQPIPVYAEMGSVNPVFLLPEALLAGGEKLAREYADSVNLGVGQFCTNPGVVFAVAGPALDRFAHLVAERQAELGPGVMLHPGIKQNYLSSLGELAGRPGVGSLGVVSAETKLSDCFVTPALLRTTAERFLDDPLIAEEVFGPSALIIACSSFQQLLECAAKLTGQLTATVQAAREEEELCRELLKILELKVGRLIYNGFPTGVEVCRAMVHGGPFPATTDCRTTSVGSEAIRRFLRPVCWQNFPRSLLPTELQD